MSKQDPKPQPQTGYLIHHSSKRSERRCLERRAETKQNNKVSNPKSQNERSTPCANGLSAAICPSSKTSILPSMPAQTKTPLNKSLEIQNILDRYKSDLGSPLFLSLQKSSQIAPCSPFPHQLKINKTRQNDKQKKCT